MPPSLTIAIATWNRARLLARTLEGLACLRVPAGLDCPVLVCDNNSTDATPATIDAAAARLAGQFSVQRLFEPRQGKSHALNRLIAAARSDWILFLDDDVLVDPGWLEGYLRGMERHPEAVCLAGPIHPWLPRPAGRRGRFLLEHYPAVYGLLSVPQDEPMGPRKTGWGANLAVRRDALPRDGFDVTSGMFGGLRIAGEDELLQLRMIYGGRQGWLLADAAVGHYLAPGDLGPRRLLAWQAGIGRRRALQRPPTPRGRFGLAWWEWRTLLLRALAAAPRWRPWPSRPWYEALAQLAQQWGAMRARPVHRPDA